MGVSKRFFTRLDQLARRIGPVLGFEHQVKQGRVLESETDIGTRQLGEAGLEILAALPSGSTQCFIEALEATQGQGIEKRLLVSEVATGEVWLTPSSRLSSRKEMS